MILMYQMMKRHSGMLEQHLQLLQSGQQYMVKDSRDWDKFSPLIARAEALIVESKMATAHLVRLFQE
jgi:hypothetical protein